MAGPVRRQQQSSSRPVSNICKTIAFILIGLLILTGLIILITWLAIKPKRIRFSVDEAWIEGYSLSDSHEFNSTFHFVISANNTNKKVSIYYDTTNVEVRYDGKIVGDGDIQGFVQPRRNVTRLKVSPEAQHVRLPNDVARHLRLERTGGAVDLDVILNGRIKSKVGLWRSRRYKLKVLCSPHVIVNFSDRKRFRPINCDVDI